MKILQGDALEIGFNVKMGDIVITPSECKSVEVSVGQYIKNSADGEVTFADGKWHFKLDQEETFGFNAYVVPIQIRVALNDSHVRGKTVGSLTVEESISKEVI